MTMGVVDLARELVRIDSPTGREGQVGAYLAAELERLGYVVTRQEVSPGRFNVFALREPPIVVLSTHIDTVPPSLPVHEDDTHLYGRGSCDAKGIAAAQVAAAERLAARGERRVGLLFVVGEELNADGAKAAAGLEPKGRYIINGEPTENHMAVGHKGMQRLDVIAHGKAAHSAYPEAGESAIELLLDALERIRAIQLPSDPTLGECTLNIGTITGGVAPNVIPSYAKAHLMYRTVTEPEPLLAAVRQAAGDRVEVAVVHRAPVVRLQVLPGFETTVVRYGTDLPFLEPWGERFLMGPGSIQVAHTDHERVAKRELDEAAVLYEKAAGVLLQQANDAVKRKS